MLSNTKFFTFRTTSFATNTIVRVPCSFSKTCRTFWKTFVFKMFKQHVGLIRQVDALLSSDTTTTDVLWRKWQRLTYFLRTEGWKRKWITIEPYLIGTSWALLHAIVTGQKSFAWTQTGFIIWEILVGTAAQTQFMTTFTTWWAGSI